LIVLVVVIPISITSAIVLSFLELDIRSQEESKRKIENQVKFTLVLALKNISSDSARLSQSNPFLDYLSVPNDLKVYSENRLFGIAREVSIQSSCNPHLYCWMPK
jgi:RNase P/RNase MRP subunit p30